ncbi:MAG TPA: SLBB domain-containing protein [Paludibacter sp.]
MKRILVTLMCFLMICSNMFAQNLNSLTPEQLEMYKKYKGGGTSSGTTNGTSTQSQETTERTMYKEDDTNTNQNQNLNDEQNDYFIKDKNGNLIKKKKKKTTNQKDYSPVNMEDYYNDNYDNKSGNNDNKDNNYQNNNANFNRINNRYYNESDSLNMDYMNNDMNPDNKNANNQRKQSPSLKVFGSDLFSGQDLTFEPKLNIPTPIGYILGTYDELIIDITGLYEANYHLKVSPEGNIRIPAIGLVRVSGQTIEAAARGIKSRCSNIYSGINSGETKITVSLGNIRSIRVTVIGEATRPGSYTLPSLATAFNALYACGGPGKVGSMRDIKVIRHGKIVANIDVYRFILDGVLGDNLSLQDEDVIKIEPYKIRTSIKGAIKHAAIFEALPEEHLQDLIRFAGGYTENAYKNNITGFRLSGRERVVVNVSEKQMATFKLNPGDNFTVETVLNKFENRVDLEGSVYRPGAYALEPGMTVKSLLAKADGIKEDAYLNLAFITRKQKNQVPEILGFNLGNVLHGLEPDILLQKDDSIEVRSLFDYREEEFVSVWGSVKSPGIFPKIDNITLKDLISKADGFTEMASTDSVEVIRIIRDPKVLRETNIKTIVFKFKIDKNLELKKGEGDFLLQNGDQVIVRSIPGFEGIHMVRIEGEVLQPGTYNIINKAERISDLVKRAGGFTHYAYPLGAYLIRYEKTSGVENILKQKMVENTKRQITATSEKNIDPRLLQQSGGTKDVKSLQSELSDTKSAQQIMDSEGIVGIDLKEILRHPGSKQDLFLEEKDILYVPRELQTVRVLGEVLFPTYVSYDKRMSLIDYISGAGGFSDRAQKRSTFVLNANGNAKCTKRFLFIRFYPKVTPGSHIVVPEKPVEIKNSMSTAETVSILGSLATVSALIFSVLK